MIKKTPFNYSNDMDRRRQGLDAIVENLLPDVSTDDAGKIVKVSEAGKWTLGDDENTIIEANPDEQPTVDLENLKIGSTVYSVKIPELTSVKSFKLTMSNGGQYNTNKPIIEFYDEAGIKASITSSDYTVECDKTYAGNAGMDQVCSISTPDTPGTFTYTFVNDFNIENYNLIKLTRGGTFVNDIAKNIKLELSADGENYLTIYDETTITWSDAVPYHLISLKDGSEASTILPIVTSSDNGKVLGVVGGVWDKTIVDSLPTIDATDGLKTIRINESHTNYEKINYGIYNYGRCSIGVDTQTEGTTSVNMNDGDLLRDIFNGMTTNSPLYKGAYHFSIAARQDHYLYMKMNCAGSPNSSSGNTPSACCLYVTDDGLSLMVAILRITSKSNKTASLIIKKIADLT